ncbi:glycosyltransferase family protein [Algoriphagus hitonicola]|uniref:Glycosyltransferase involved in cell wall bisynthesis n=1 Tax=Algoriphagus hitonicola TaxID=435880 RepID=A0A1I2VSG0_9BACT|nr:glycosyltransferase family 4 protein [Algoriphagus hitonicola]SFG92080.1 Glycosyltransferase involved in cell wall bisynthesis [Algoriphagus hitonicola]
MEKKKKLLFITWDSGTSNYLETLFFPIFDALSQKYGLEVSVIQFSWADKSEVSRINHLAEKAQIKYFHYSVYRKPVASLAAIYSLWIRRKVVLKLIRSQNFDWIMPRSTMPALLIRFLARQINWNATRLAFDADGLPIQERIDFSRLKKGSGQHRFLVKIEKEMLQKADIILTRSNAAIDWHLKENRELNPNKFFKVINGRDPQLFQRNENSRTTFRAKWGIRADEKVLVHSGSLGNAYYLKPVFELMERDSRLKLLILSRNSSWMEQNLPLSLKDRVMSIEGAFKEIQAYLSAADLGICLRTPAPSLKGLAPIKLGEYLLCGLPVWLSPEIGDLRQELGGQESCFLADQNLDQILDWLMGLSPEIHLEARELGLQLYSLEQSAMSYGRALGC